MVDEIQVRSPCNASNMLIDENCYVCGSKATVQHEAGSDKYFYVCPVCGRYECNPEFSAPEFSDLKSFDLNMLGPFLLYNGFKHNARGEYRYFTTMSKEKCDEYKKSFDQGDRTHGHPVRLEKETVENWYPKTFAEKVDKILLYFNSCFTHVGDSGTLDDEELTSCLFVDRYDYKKGERVKRTIKQIADQKIYMMNFLHNEKYIDFIDHDVNEKKYVDGRSEQFALSPGGYARIDMIQKNSTIGNNVLVAMKFGEDTKKLREAIRSGIKSAGYHEIFIDEVEHNDFITQKLLKYIKDSKFVVADLTHQNNGAYFEEGYAMGLGKPVIQLCKKDVTLHFDIAQKNTIMWEKEDDIPERLKNRIIATID